jgi:hypothetical protein
MTIINPARTEIFRVSRRIVDVGAVRRRTVLAGGPSCPRPRCGAAHRPADQRRQPSLSISIRTPAGMRGI